MSVTINDVAKKAAVSTATASRALRGQPNVAPATRERVLQVAKELDYNINPQASRVLSDLKVVAIFTPLANQWFYSTILTAATFKFYAQGFEVVHYSVDSIEAQSELVQRLVDQNLIDACITTSFPLDETAINYLQVCKLPVVTLESNIEGFNSFSIDNVAASQLATQHLINLGHKRIGIIMGGEDFSGMHNTMRELRYKGYKQALEIAGLQTNPTLQNTGNDIYEGGAEAMQNLMSIADPPTAVYAVTDEMAIGALKTIRSMNLRVPEDISIIGFDDNDISEQVGLTTIKQPVTSYGELAAERVIELLLEDNPPEVKHIELEYKLIIRSSTGPLNLKS